MDRLDKLRELVEQALDELSRPTVLTHEQYAVVAALHQIAREISALQADRFRLMALIRRTRSEPGA